MIITKKQLEEIRRGLAVLGVRDSDLPNATTLTGAELVAIVQGNENRKVAVGDLFGKYLEGMLPYAVRGMSAYEIAVANGYTGTVEQWLASLQAAIEIDNTFSGGVYKVASAEEAKWLKESLLALQNIAITKSDVVNTLTSNASDKPLSAAMGKELKRLISTGSGQSVNVVDNLNSTSSTDALSAKQGKVLKDLIDSMVEVNNWINKIYKWSEFQNLTKYDPDIKNDSTSSIVDARVAYELWMLIQRLTDRVSALENGSGGGGGSDDGGDSGDDGGDSGDDGGGSQKKGSIGVSTAYIVANSDGLFKNSDNEYEDETVSVIVTTKDTTSKWDYEVKYSKVTSSGEFIEASKVLGDSNTLNISIAEGSNNKKNGTNRTFEGSVKVYLVDEPTVFQTIIVNQKCVAEEFPFRIIDASGGTSGRVDKMGGDYALFVHSRGGAWRLTDKDGLTIVPDSGGNKYEERITVSVPLTEATKEYTITGEELSTGETASYTILQDAAMVNTIRLTDDDGMGQAAISGDGGVKALKVYASSAWRVVVEDSSWIVPYDTTHYPWSGNTGTGASGATIYIQISSSSKSRLGKLVASLTSPGLTNYTSTMFLNQYGLSDGSYTSSYSAYFTVYGDYSPIGTSEAPMEGTANHGVALVFQASRGSKNIAWGMVASDVDAYDADWLHINHYSATTIDGESYYLHIIDTREGDYWEYIACDIDPLPENTTSRSATIQIDVFECEDNWDNVGNHYYTYSYAGTVCACLTQGTSTGDTSSVNITAEIVGGTEFSYSTRSVTINANCDTSYENVLWEATVGGRTTDITPTINGGVLDYGDAPDSNVQLVIGFDGDNVTGEDQITEIVLSIVNAARSQRYPPQKSVIFTRLADSESGSDGSDGSDDSDGSDGSDGSDDTPVIPATPVGYCEDNMVWFECATAGATIYYKGGYVLDWEEFSGDIEIYQDTVFSAYSELDGETSSTVSFTAYYEAPSGSDGSDGSDDSGWEPEDSDDSGYEPGGGSDGYEITLGDYSMSFSESAGSDSTSISPDDTSYSIEVSASGQGWISANIQSGTLSVSVTANNGSSSRSGYVTISNNGGGEAVLTVSQDAPDSSETPNISVSPMGSIVDYNVTSASFTVNALNSEDGTWTASAGTGATLDVGCDSGSVGDTVSFSFDPNTDTTGTKSYSVTVYAEKGGNTASATFTVVQGAKPVAATLSLEPATGLALSATDTSASVTVTCSTTWELSADSWIRPQTQSGSAGTTTVTLLPLVASTPQSGTITVTADDPYETSKTINVSMEAWSNEE